MAIEVIGNVDYMMLNDGTYESWFSSADARFRISAATEEICRAATKHFVAESCISSVLIGQTVNGTTIKVCRFQMPVSMGDETYWEFFSFIVYCEQAKK